MPAPVWGAPTARGHRRRPAGPRARVPRLHEAAAIRVHRALPVLKVLPVLLRAPGRGPSPPKRSGATAILQFLMVARFWLQILRSNRPGCCGSGRSCALMVRASKAKIPGIGRGCVLSLGTVFRIRAGGFPGCPMRIGVISMGLRKADWESPPTLWRVGYRVGKRPGVPFR